MRRMVDQRYMGLALQLAEKARGHTLPNPMVGAVLVKAGRVIARGYHKYCGADHAEIMALKKAGRHARGSVLYVNLEPCGHYGRTPPCVDRIIDSGIRRVVVGMKDPNPLNNGKSIRRLRKAGIKVTTGILKSESQRLNAAFVKYITTGRPYVVVKTAQTLDGKIATATGQSKWITAPKTRAFARYLRNDFSGIMVGIRTILKDDPLLDCEDKTKHLKKIIVDSTLRIPQNAKVLNNTLSENVYIATTTRSPRKKREVLAQKGVNIIVCPDSKGGVSLKWLLRYLAGQQIASVLIEGGAHLIGRVHAEKLADKAYVFIAPKIMGDQAALSAVDGVFSRDVNKLIRLRNMEFWRIGEDIFIEGSVEYNRI